MFTTTVTSSGGIPAGIVTFRDGTTVFGTVTLDPGGIALTSVTTLTLGSHNDITAQYTGDTNFVGSTSGAINHTVKKSVTITLTVLPIPVTVGKPITLTAIVTPTVGTQSGPNRATLGTPTGNVTFRDGQSVLDTAPLINGNATCTIPLSADAHNFSAQCTGDGEFGPGVSDTVIVSGDSGHRLFLPFILR